jgi:hypothetical protein
MLLGNRSATIRVDIPVASRACLSFRVRSINSIFVNPLLQIDTNPSVILQSIRRGTSAKIAIFYNLQAIIGDVTQYVVFDVTKQGSGST